MIQSYRTYGAMLELGQFTVAELAEASGVGLATVRTVIGRRSHWLDVVGEEPSGRRGGRWHRYRLNEVGRQEARRQLERFGAAPPDPAEVVPGAADDEVPDVLVAANEILLQRLPEEEDHETREELARSAARMLQDGGEQAERLPSDSDAAARARAHQQVGRLLLQLRDTRGFMALGGVRALLAAVSDRDEELSGAVSEFLARESGELEPVEAAGTIHAGLLAGRGLASARRAVAASASHAPARSGAALGADTTLAGLADLGRRLGEDVVVAVVSAGAGSSFTGGLAPLIDPIPLGDREIVVVAAPHGQLGLDFKAPVQMELKTHGLIAGKPVAARIAGKELIEQTIKQLG